VGNGKQVRIGSNPKAGSGKNHLLPVHLEITLQDRGLFHLYQLVDP